MPCSYIVPSLDVDLPFLRSRLRGFSAAFLLGFLYIGFHRPSPSVPFTIHSALFFLNSNSGLDLDGFRSFALILPPHFTSSFKHRHGHGDSPSPSPSPSHDLSHPPSHSKVPVSKCATKSSSATPSASVSTSNTPLTPAPPTVSAATPCRKRQCWWGMRARDILRGLRLLRPTLVVGRIRGMRVPSRIARFTG